MSRDKAEVAMGAVGAALILLHRELDRAAEVRLTMAEIEAYANEDPSTRIEFERDPDTDDVIIRHFRPGKHDA